MSCAAPSDRGSPLTPPSPPLATPPLSPPPPLLLLPLSLPPPPLLPSLPLAPGELEAWKLAQAAVMTPDRQAFPSPPSLRRQIWHGATIIAYPYGETT